MKTKGKNNRHKEKASGYLDGIARVLDLGCTYKYYTIQENSELADYNALKSDWITVGNDIKRSMDLIKI